MANIFAPTFDFPSGQRGESLRIGQMQGTSGLFLPRSGGHGDVNGDGLDDLIVGTLTMQPGSGLIPGISVRFGSLLALDGPDAPLSAARIGTGFDIVGAAVNDGLDLFAIADVNGDGFDDMLLGAREAGAGSSALGDGRAYVIFGGPALDAVTQIDLRALDGINGVELLGPAASAHQSFGLSAAFGTRIAAADLDGDGIADMIVGSPYAGPMVQSGGEGGARRLHSIGEVYIIFGEQGSGAEDFGGNGRKDLDVLDPSGLSVIFGVAASGLGEAVQVPGDVNGDGYADLAIGGHSFNAEVTIVFGGPGLRGADRIEAASIGGVGTSTAGAPTGFRIFDSTPDVEIMPVIAPGIDFDGDGLADIVLSRILPDGTTTIEIIHGAVSLGSTDIDLATLPANQRTTIVNTFANEFARGVDINGDGIDDLVFGNPGLAHPTAGSTGGLVVVFGRAGRGVIDGADLDGSDGFAAYGPGGSFGSGWSVGVSDIDGDGIAELSIWADGMIHVFEPQPVGAIPVNRPPVARDDMIVLSGRGPHSGDLFADNGSGPDSDPDGDVIRVSSATDGSGTDIAIPAGGQQTLLFVGPAPGSAVAVDVRSDGTLAVRPEGSFDALPGGTQFEFAMSYTITDGQAESTALASFAHTAPPNAAPVARDDLIFLPRRGAHVADLFADNGSGPDFDPDADMLRIIEVTDRNGAPVVVPEGGTVTLRYPGAAGPLEFESVIGADGSVMVTPAGGFEGVPVDAFSSFGFSYVLSDGQATDTAIAEFRHVAANQVPVARPDLIVLPGRGPHTADLMADNGSGPDIDRDGDQLRIAAVFDHATGSLVPVPLSGAVSVTHPGPRPGDTATLDVRDNGVVTFRPTGAFDTMPLGEIYRAEVMYILSDGQSTSSATAEFIHEARNAAPVAQDDLITLNRTGDTLGNLFVDNGNGPDIDSDGDTLSIPFVQLALTGQSFQIAPGTTVSIPIPVAVTGRPTELIEAEIGSDGNFRIRPGDALRGVPIGDTFEFDLLYGVTDGVDGDFAVARFEFVGSNRPPVAFDDTLTLADRGGATANLLEANGGLPDSDPDADPIRVLWVRDSTGMPVNVPVGGEASVMVVFRQGLPVDVSAEVRIGSDGSLHVIDIPGGLPGGGTQISTQASFEYAITDGFAISAPATVQLTLTSQNLPPVAGNDMIDLGTVVTPRIDLKLDTGAGPDFDPEGAPLSYELWVGNTPVSQGQAITLQSGLRIIPTTDPGVYDVERTGAALQVPAGFTGSESFNYLVRDPVGQTSGGFATATLVWEGLPDVPLLGTPGADSLFGTQRDNYIMGLEGDDTISGVGGNNRLFGGNGDDQIIGGPGNDILVGGGGDDTLIGGGGQNIAVYSGNRTDYEIVSDGAILLFVRDLRSNGDGTDTLRQIQTLQFADTTVDAVDFFDSVMISGSVSGLGGPGLGGINLTFYGTDGAPLMATASAADGSFSVTLPVGEVARLDASRDYLPGAGGDPAITALDALDVLRMAVGVTPSFGAAAPQNFVAADINRDGQVTALDALEVLRSAVGLGTAHAPEWVFFDAATDWDGLALSRAHAMVPTGVDLSSIAPGADIGLASILLGHMAEI